MITPKFSVDQDQEFVKVEIHAPHIRATDVELYIEGDEFKFHLAPYFLRLHLPGRVVEDDRATSSYDVAAGIITCKLPKETPGETFEGLDMLTTLLARRVERPQGPLIEVLEEDGGEDMKHESMDEKGDPAFSEAKEFDWQLPQNLPEEPLTEALGGVKYGFNRAYSGYFLHWRERSVDEVCEILDPEITALSDRVEQRETMENGKFDEDYYIADMVNAEDYAHVLQYRTGWWKALRDIQRVKSEDKTTGPLENADASKKASSALTLSSKDQEMMLQLPRKEYLLDDEKTIYLGLVDLLFAYSYDHRVNEGEPTVESAWLISKLSASISGFMEFQTLAQVVRTCARRALAYPLYRSIDLVGQVLRDVYVLLKLGRVACLRALLQVKSILDRHDVYYVYSRIWVDDYCRWIQSASEEQIKSLASELHHFPLNKGALGWDLVALDEVAAEAKAEGGMVELMES